MIHYVYQKIKIKDRQRMYKQRTEASKPSLQWKNSITHSECLFVTFVKQHASSYVACLDVLYFSTLYHKRHDFQEKVADHEVCMCVFVCFFFL